MSGDTQAFAGLVRLHQQLIQRPGAGETCAAWREYCSQHPCPQWVPTFDRQPLVNSSTEPRHPDGSYRETDVDRLELAGADQFHEIPQERIDAAIRIVVDTEGPVHLRILTHRLLTAAGFARAGSRIQAVIRERRAQLAVAGAVELDGDFTGRPEQFRVPCLRDWTPLPDNLRQLDHVHDSELMLALLHAVVEAGSLDTDTAMNNALYMLGFIRLTDNGRARLGPPLTALLEQSMLTQNREGLEPGVRAFQRPTQ